MKTYKVNVWTDGACNIQTRCGGWASLLCCNGLHKTLSGYAQDVTNNQMELTAVLKVLKAFKPDHMIDVVFYTDSKYVSNAFNQR